MQIPREIVDPRHDGWIARGKTFCLVNVAVGNA